MAPSGTATRHLYIGGAGRTGAGFLVRYLTALGLDTALSRDETGGRRNDSSGFDSDPERLSGPDVPYVVKASWLHLVADRLIATAAGRIDGLIVPLSDPSKAARTRVALERATSTTADAAETAATGIDPWGVTQATPDHPLREADQMRVLAVGFHTLIERFVAADLPIVFVHFPRSLQDGDYLYRKLRPFLPPAVTGARAEEAFRKVSGDAEGRLA